MAGRTLGRTFQERTEVLASWLRGIQDSEFWRPYHQETIAQQCNHPDRMSQIKMLVSNGDLIVKGRVAFLLKVRGPCEIQLKPTILDKFPGELVGIYHDLSIPPTINSEPLLVGDIICISEPPDISMSLEGTLFLFVTFTKC